MNTIQFAAPQGCFKLYLIHGNKPLLLEKFYNSKTKFTLQISSSDYDKENYLYAVCGNLNAVFFLKPKTQKVVLNELTTIATIFCFARLFRGCKCIPFTSEKRLLKIAHGFKKSFVCDNGVISKVITSNPNGLETNSLPLFNYLANLLYYCNNDSSIQTDFLNLTNSKSLIKGFLTVALHPFDNVTAIYDLIKDLAAIYQPALNTIMLPPWKTSTVPNQWTLTIKINNSGSKNFLIAGPGYIVFDKDDKAWVPLNVRQGTPNSCTFAGVFEHDGRPADFSPLFGGGLLGGGFGVAANKCGNTIAFGNFGWGPTDYNPQDGSITVVRSNGKILSPPNGYVKGFRRAQGLFYDKCGNLWISGWGDEDPFAPSSTPNTFDFPSSTSRVVVYIGGNPNKTAIFEFPNQYYHTFDVVVDDDGNAYVSNAGDAAQAVPSSIYHLKLVCNKLVEVNSWTSTMTEGFRQVNISPKGTVVVAAVVTKKVYKFDKNLTPLGAFTNKMDGPWGIVFDKKGTMYVSNFRDEVAVADPATYDMDGVFGVTIVYNEDDSTAEIATLPSGGDEIMLANGFPLYGNLGKPSYEPLMRLTGSNIDALGNLWAVNNWKPALMTDLGGNPGGDGMVIFISLAVGELNKC